MNIINVSILLFVVVVCLPAQQEQFRFRSDLLSWDQPERTTFQDAAAVPRKSAATAVLYSLVLPGMGELYADGFDEGRYSLAAEGGLWLTYLSFRQYGTWIQNDSRNFAAVHAGAQTAGKEEQFFVDMGNFMDNYKSDEKQLQDRELEKVYNGKSGYEWKWDSDENRREYRAMRVSGERVLNNSKFVIATIVVNRIISAINAARLVRMYNKRSADALGSWHLESSLINDGLKPDGLRLSLIRRL